MPDQMTPDAHLQDIGGLLLGGSQPLWCASAFSTPSTQSSLMSPPSVAEFAHAPLAAQELPQHVLVSQALHQRRNGRTICPLQGDPLAISHVCLLQRHQQVALAVVEAFAVRLDE